LTSFIEADYGLLMFIVQTVLLVVLVSVLIFNLTQRKHIACGGEKRLASLELAGLIFIPYLAASVILKKNLSWTYIFPATAVAFILGLIFRKKIFMFRRHCLSCGTALPLHRTLYHDNNLCKDCEQAGSRGKTPEASTKKKISIPEVSPQSVNDIDWETWVPTEKAVLCYIRSGGKLLLIRKKTGLGTGKINVPGGRIEPGETAIEAAARETREEVCVNPKGLVQAGELSFVFTNGYSLHGTVFVADGYEGNLAETEEAEPFWCSEDDIPYKEMWEDDAVWLPLVLDGQYVTGRFIFDEDEMLSHTIEVTRDYR